MTTRRLEKELRAYFDKAPRLSTPLIAKRLVADHGDAALEAAVRFLRELYVG
jgi:hypothetical protein